MVEEQSSKQKIDHREAKREHRSVFIRDYLTEQYPEYRLGPDWWDTTHPGGEQCFRLDSEKEVLEVRVVGSVMMDDRYSVEDIETKLQSWDPKNHKRVRVTEEGVKPL